MWRSLVSRLVRVQEASGSNPDTPTKKHRIGFIPVLFFYCKKPEASWCHPRAVCAQRRASGGICRMKCRTQCSISSGSNPDTPTSKRQDWIHSSPVFLLQETRGQFARILFYDTYVSFHLIFNAPYTENRGVTSQYGV